MSASLWRRTGLRAVFSAPAAGWALPCIGPARPRLLLIVKARPTFTLVCALAAALAAAGCGSEEPKSAADPGRLQAGAGAGAGTARAPVPAPGLSWSDGGTDAFRRQLAALRGYPVVVNKWASWCGPCRFEFPFFQRLVTKRGKQVAFLGR